VHPSLPLPAQLFLLAVNPNKERLTRRSELGYVLRAGALAELLLRGDLVDEDGRAVPVRASGPADPVLGPVFQQVAEGRRRRWSYWVKAGARKITGVVRDQLAAQRYLTVESYRVLGIFPARRIQVVDPLLYPRMVQAVDGILGGASPVDHRDAMLVALAGAGELLPRGKRREHRKRIAELREQAGPVPAALAKVLREVRSAAASGAG
jgi:hypothetical protein